jgi:DNA-binding CsgD family transcriptional regulator
VLAYLAYGLSAKEVAHNLNLSCRTVDTFRTRALLKLRARNTADAVRMLASLSAIAGTADPDRVEEPT